MACAKYLLLLSVCWIKMVLTKSSPTDRRLRSLTEAQTRLPCQYEALDGETVVQVTWYKELEDGSKDQIITAHFTEGHKEFGRYAGRVRFENSRPTDGLATLLIPVTEESDEGTYICHFSTFPNGNFDHHLRLTVWTLPISSLEPVVMSEGQSYDVAATCRAVGRPAPLLSWDTQLPGKVQNRTSEGGAVTAHFLLHPLRSMNGKRLDCLVWHPALSLPRRLANNMVVHYPPDASITLGSADLFVGLENAELSCESRGEPTPHSITWTWGGGALPDGVSVIGGKLVFGRALRSNDSGVYECVVKNIVGTGKAEYTLTVAEMSRGIGLPSDNDLLLIIIGSSAAALVLILVLVVLLVNRHHRHRNKKLEMELSVKTEEINNISRQASLRRLNSVSTDPRVNPEDYSLLRVDSRMKNSQLSLERPIYKGSQSTLGGPRWGGPGVEVDELGRPVVWADGRESLREAEEEEEGEREERRRRVESYLKNSNMSLDSGLPSSLVPMKAQQEDGLGPQDPDLVHLRGGDSPGGGGQGWPPQLPEEEGEEEEDDSSNSCQISEALTNHFYYRNGLLRPKPHSNAILLHHRGQVI